MDYKNKLMNFWGYIPTFHDDLVSYLALKDGVLSVDITTKINNVLHESLYGKYSEVITEFKFVNINNIEFDLGYSGKILLSNVEINKVNDTYFCKFDGQIGYMTFTCDDVEVKNIISKPFK